MDISIQNPCNLEIETTHTTSSTQKEEVIIIRNWLELPPDVTSLIFMKLGTIDILAIAQWVCTSWWKLSRQPHLFRSIHVSLVLTIFGRPTAVSPYSIIKFTEGLAREAIDRSCGQLVQFFVKHVATDELLHYMSEKSNSVRCLRLIHCNHVTGDRLIEVCNQFPQLEELELCGCSFSESVFATVGCLCPHLKSFRLNYLLYPRLFMLDGVAEVIAERMPELRHLNRIGDSLTDVGLRAILKGCPNLQSLDLRRCLNLKFDGNLKKMPANIKLRLPNDSIDDFKDGAGSCSYISSIHHLKLDRKMKGMTVCVLVILAMAQLMVAPAQAFTCATAGYDSELKPQLS